uniref:Altered inheritance of mitochondria protein 24, mitochondrial n=1 Tax=Panagrellus redivivus TaxID=6233 RepID=A0A7E4VCG9_PANRE
MPPRQSIVILRSRMRFLPILCLVAIVLASVIGLPATVSHVPKSVSRAEIPATANFVTDRHRVNIDLVPENVIVPTPEFRTPIDSADKNCHGHVDITYQTVASCPSAIDGWLTSRIVMHGGDVMVLNNASQGTGLKMKTDSEYEVSIAGSQIYVFEDGNVVLASNALCEPISDKFEVNRKGLICQPTQNPITAFRRFETIMALYTCFFFFLLGVSTSIFCLPLISKCTSPSTPQPKPQHPCVQRDTSYSYVPLHRDESQISSARHFFVAPEDMYSMEAVFHDEYNPQMQPSTEGKIAAAKSISGVVRATIDKHDPIKSFNSSLNLGPHISDITDDDFSLRKPIYHLVDVDLNNNNRQASNSRSDSGIAYDIINEEKEEDDISIQTCIENES